MVRDTLKPRRAMPSGRRRRGDWAVAAIRTDGAKSTAPLFRRPVGAELRDYIHSGSATRLDHVR
jgi:hypothetical protein